jgi:hypothetical protein
MRSGICPVYPRFSKRFIINVVQHVNNWYSMLYDVSIRNYQVMRVGGADNRLNIELEYRVFFTGQPESRFLIE